ncbi:MAG: hypothetical protein LBS41_06035 [Streptococcaceae bacterium]|nr:hypothetical protein [Streptococcaceae bacterium]
MNVKKTLALVASTSLLFVMGVASASAETASATTETVTDYKSINYPKVSPRALAKSEILKNQNSRIFEVTPLDPDMISWTHTDIDYGAQNPTQAAYQYTYEFITNYIYNASDPEFANGFAITVEDFLKIKEAELDKGAIGYQHWTLPLREMVNEGKVKLTDEIVCLPRERDFTSSNGRHGWIKYINPTTPPVNIPMPAPEKEPVVDMTGSDMSDFLVWAVKHYYGGMEGNTWLNQNDCQDYITTRLGEYRDQILNTAGVSGVNLAGVFKAANSIDPDITAQLFWRLGLQNSSVSTFKTIDLSDNGFTNALVTTGWMAVNEGVHSSAITTINLTGNASDLQANAYQPGYCATDGIFPTVFPNIVK